MLTPELLDELAGADKLLGHSSAELESVGGFNVEAALLWSRNRRAILNHIREQEAERARLTAALGEAEAERDAFRAEVQAMKANIFCSYCGLTISREVEGCTTMMQAHIENCTARPEVRERDALRRKLDGLVEAVEKHLSSLSLQVNAPVSCGILGEALVAAQDTPLLLDTDYVARMSPHKFTVGLKVSDVRKGEPRPVEPDTPGPTQADTERLVAEFLAIQTRFTDSQRVDFWAELAQGYCMNCGRKEKGTEICQCENDE